MDDLRKLTADRICVIKPSAFGDVVQALPLLEGLRKRFPSAEISWVINAELADLVTGHPHLSRVHCFNRRGSFLEQIRFLRQLRSQRFDLVLDLQGLLRTGLMTWATGAKWRLGLETAREGSAWTCSHILPQTSKNIPAHARYWKVAAALGIEGPRPAAQIHVPTEATALAEALLGPLRVGGRSLLAIHPGAKWETKRWPAAKFVDVVKRIAHRTSLVVVGTASEQPVAQQIVSAALGCGGVALDLTGRTGLKPLAAVLQRVDAMLSNDSGPMHLAAELGTPVVGLFTCTDPVRSGPPEGMHILKQAEVSCAGGYHKTCPHSGPQKLACFNALDPARIAAATLKLMDGEDHHSIAA